MLGLDEHGIRNLSRPAFEQFMEMKFRQENLILGHTPIIVTTCNSANNRRLRDYRFKKVIIDEATQAQELETLLVMKNAEQVVLIGDHKQLGPIYKNTVPKCDSMFSRLVEAKYSNFTMLTTQYRMHPYLLQVPNTLFYDGVIDSGYVQSISN